ncbi:MAG: hypothetical protein ABF542_09375 [Gluconobacter sp.]
MTRTPLFLSDLCCCERLALWSIRCLVSRYRLSYCHETRTTDGMFPASFRPVLDAAERAFEDAAQHLREAGQPVLDINPPGSQGLSAMEERFLQGIQTVQNDGQKEVFHLLADLFPERLMQGYIVTALALISDCMAGIGHWLPRHERKTAGAGALSSLARWKKIHPAEMRVLWPRDIPQAWAGRTLH